MAVTAGEVTAVLKARDEMSAAVATVTQRVADLERQISQLGTTSGPSFGVLTSSLYAAKQQLGELKLGVVELDQQVAGFSQKSSESVRAVSSGFEQMDRLAVRMVERMAVFYALKESFGFVTGLYEGAAAMVALSEESGYSINRLQELQYAADISGVKFEKFTSAADSFNKKLAEMKPTTVDTLAGLSIGFNQLFSLDPDGRLNLVATAIGNIPDRLQRAKAEVALFGTDAIDPMIKNLLELEKAARDANAVMGDDTTRVLAQAATAYRDAGHEVSTFFSNMFAGAVKATAAIAELQTVGKPSDDLKSMIAILASGGGLGDVIRALTHKDAMGDVFLPHESTPGTPNGPLQDAPLTGQAFVDSLKAQSLAVRELTFAQLNEVQQLSQMNQLTAENAARLNITSTQYRELTRNIAEARKEETLLEAEDRQAATVRERALLLTTKLQDQYNELLEAGGTKWDQQIAAIDRWAADVAAQAQKSGTDIGTFYDDLANVQTAKIKALITGTKAFVDAATYDTKRGLQQQADIEKERYYEALKHVGEWSDETIEKFRVTYEKAQRAADAWGGANMTWIDGLVKKQADLRAAIDATAAAQRAATGFFVDPAKMFVNPFILPQNIPLAGARAQGGPVQAGMSYLVNEDTPHSEVFTPTVPGFITPAGVGGGRNSGGFTIAPTIVVQAMVPTDPRAVEVLRKAVDDAVTNSLRNLVRMGRA